MEKLNYEQIAGLLEVSPSTLLKKGKVLEPKIQALGYVKEGKGTKALYVKSGEVIEPIEQVYNQATEQAIDMDELCYNQLKFHLMDSGCIKQNTRFNYDKWINYLGLILIQPKESLLKSKDYIKALRISEKTYKTFRKYANELGLIRPTKLSKCKFYALYVETNELGHKMYINENPIMLEKEILQEEYYEIFRSFYNPIDSDFNEINGDVENLELLDLIRAYGYEQVFTRTKTEFNPHILQEVGLMDLIVRAIRYKHPELVKINRLDEKYIINDHRLSLVLTNGIFIDELQEVI